MATTGFRTLYICLSVCPSVLTEAPLLQVRRFRTQYVTSKALTHEWKTRHQFGLPEGINDVPEQARKLRSRGKKVDPNPPPGELRHRNLAKFQVMFDSRLPRAPKPKPPKMEGIDTVIMKEDDPRGQCMMGWIRNTSGVMFLILMP